MPRELFLSMRLFTILFVAVVSGRAAIISNASVRTYGSLPGNICSMQSTGATVDCQTKDTEVTASASVMGLSAIVNISSGGGLLGIAGTTEANAGFDDLFIVNSVAGNVLFGLYSYSFMTASDFGSFGASSVNIQQGDSSTFKGGVSSGSDLQQLSLQSTIQPGVPFKERVTANAFGGTPGSENARAQFQFLGFIDGNGNTVPFQIVADTPEPATWVVTTSGGILLLILLRRRQLRLDAFAKC